MLNGQFYSLLPILCLSTQVVILLALEHPTKHLADGRNQRRICVRTVNATCRARLAGKLRCQRSEGDCCSRRLSWRIPFPRERPKQIHYRSNTGSRWRTPRRVSHGNPRSLGRLVSSTRHRSFTAPLQVLISSIKVEVKKKHFSFGWNFSCFAAHLIERELF